jgi:hypothetical protein
MSLPFLPVLCYNGGNHHADKPGGKEMDIVMTDKQFKTILEMVDMILDGCKDLDEAKRKVQKLIENQGGKKED